MIAFSRNAYDRYHRHLDPETTNRLSSFASWRFLFVSGFRYFPAAHYKLNVADPEDRSIATELFLSSQVNQLFVRRNNAAL